MQDAIKKVRKFSRFYTSRLGLLDRGLLESDFSLAEVRVMYELAHRKDVTAGEVGLELAIDGGYLSRILQGLKRRGIIRAIPAKGDRRQRLLSLTEKGRAAFRRLDLKANAQVRDMLRTLPTGETRQLIDAMGGVERLLSDPGVTHEGTVAFRDPLPGDLGWVVERHGTLYAAEYGWSQEFETMVAGIVGEFAVTRSGKGARQRCWIATIDGVRAGCVFLMPASQRVGKLRMLLVEPWARGHGLGEHLIRLCVAAGWEAGYRRMTLYTNGRLTAARKLYQKAGFQLIKTEAEMLWGGKQVGQTWELDRDA